MPDQDYYQTLGVSKTATDSEIKKAYYKLARKYHPDRHQEKSEDEKNKMAQKFATISGAFDILSNSELREIYDKYGQQGLDAKKAGVDPSQFGSGGMPSGFGGFGGGGGGGMSQEEANRVFQSAFGSMFGGGFNPRTDWGQGDDDPFAAMFGGGGFGGGFGGGRRGGGGGGGGMRRAPRQAAPVTMQLPVSLEDYYKGKVKKLKLTRKTRSGPTEKIIEIPIKPGFKAGTKVTFEKHGDERADGGPPADVIIELTEKKHSHFRRVGSDLYFDARLHLKEALLGGELSIMTLDGRRLQVPYEGPVQVGQTKIVANEGMPIRKGGQNVGKGNLRINFTQIVMPTSLTAAQKRKIEETF